MTKKYFLDAFIVFISLLIVLVAFPPIWRTNDDVAMAMFAHGYGLASEPSQHIFFSNVIWGHIVQFFPSIAGADPYSIATFTILLLSCLGIAFIANLFNVPRALMYILLLLVMFGAIVSPQFTINAGLCGVLAVLFYQAYQNTCGDWVYLVLATTFVCLGFLIRNYEVILVLFIAFPFYFNLKLFRDLKVVITAIFILGFGFWAYTVDRNDYMGKEWSNFNELNNIRAAYTDFNLDKIVVQNPEVMESQGFSINDINLISNWFFEDDYVSDPTKLKKMGDGVKHQIVDSENITERLIAGFKVVLDRNLKILFMVSLIVLCLCFSWPLLFAWCCLLFSVCIISVAGRPGVARVYEAVLILLIVYPLLFNKLNSVKYRILIFFLGLGAFINTDSVVNFHKEVYTRAESDYELIKTFGTDPVVIWGGGLTYEQVYPLFPIGDFNVRTLKFYGLGVTALAPNSIANDERLSGSGMLDLLFTQRGVEIIASSEYLELLDTYCRERHGSFLTILSSRYSRPQPIQRMNCSSEDPDGHLLSLIIPILLYKKLNKSKKSLLD